MSDKLEIFSKKTKSGLNLQVIPMPKYNQVYAIAMTDFGSVDLLNPLLNKTLPAGIAHFIEHKLFAKKGYDSSDKFALYGANANAYTSYTKTAYLFQTFDNVEENLSVLLDLVSHPYFTDENVDKERGIIDQEVKMYLDMPEWKIEQKILSKLYPDDPISFDIAGTSETLKQINKDNLLETYNTFYNQKNMNLVLVGNVSAKSIFSFMDRNDILINENEIIKTKIPNKKAVLEGSSQIEKINQTKSTIGIKINDDIYQDDPIKIQYMLNMIFEIFIGESSNLYEFLLNKRLINNNFGYSVIVERGNCFVLIGGDTDNPEGMRKNVLPEFNLEHFKDIASDETVERFKRDILGSLIFSKNSPESIANQQAELYFYNRDINDLIEIINNISKEDLFLLTENILREENISYVDLIGGEDE